MTYLVALGLMLLGISIVLSVLRLASISGVLGLLVAAISAHEFLAYLLGFQLLKLELISPVANESKSVIEIGLSHLGLMAGGIALIIHEFEDRRVVKDIVVVLGTFQTAVGIASIIGFLNGTATVTGLGITSEVSIHGAIAHLLVGISMVVATIGSENFRFKRLSNFIPALVLLVGLTGTFLVRQYLVIQEIGMIDSRIGFTADSVRTSMISSLETFVESNSRLQLHEGLDKNGSIDAWKLDATTRQEQSRQNLVAALINEKLEILSYVPDSGSTTLLDYLIENEGETIRTDIISGGRQILGDFIVPGKGSVFYSAAHIKTANLVVVSVMDTEAFISASVPSNLLQAYKITVSDGTELIYSNSTAGTDKLSQQSHSTSISLDGANLTVRVEPRRETLQGFRTNNNEYSMLIGIVFSMLLSGAFYLAQKARKQSQITSVANARLVAEVEGRKEVERILRKTSTFREAILNGANFIIISTDPSGVVTSFNKTAEFLLGYASGEVVGKKRLIEFMKIGELLRYNDFLCRDSGAEIETGFETLVSKARASLSDEQEWTFIGANENEFPVSLAVSAIRDETGQISGYLAIGRDNSQLKSTSQKLIESEERFGAFVDHAPALVYAKDSKGRFRFSNNRFESILGFSQDDLIGKTVFDLAEPELASRIDETERRIFASGRSEESIEAVKASDGRVLHFLFVRFILPTSGNEPMLGVIAIDVTQQKEIEDELREASKAALESSKLKSEFLANMSHEIRTPMNGVLGMLEVLLDTPLNTSQQEYAEVIQQSARALLRVIDDILDLSKLEAGKLAFEAIGFDLRSTVENTVALFVEQANSKGIEVVSLIERDVPTGLVGDPGRLRQVLTNLIGNAVKFTESGTVTITVKAEETVDGSARLRFSVVDTGIGINKDAQKYLFQPFVQADGSMVRKYGGSGLGLSISKQLVELMNGEIGIESEPGQGSDFSFTAQFGTYEIPDRSFEMVDLCGLKVLIADDCSANRKNISYQLQGLGIETYEAENGDECEELLIEHAEKKQPFDILILDLEMPYLDGFEIAGKIKADSRFENLKIILMPSLGRRGHSENAVRNGISAYLVKPVKQVELFDCLSTLIGRTRKNTREDGSENETLITRHSLMDRRSENGGPILIATSDLSHQRVMGMQLELLGHKSEVVSNAHELFEALKKRRYETVLIDIENEAFGGFSASRRIVRMGFERIPRIVGFAEAITTDHRDRAFESSMIGTLELPVTDVQMQEILAAEVPETVEEDIHTTVAPLDIKFDASGISDFVEEMLGEVGYDMTMMSVGLFVDESKRHLRELEKAVVSDDWNTVASASEKLSAAAVSVGSNSMSKIAQFLSKAPNVESRENLRLIRIHFERTVREVERKLSESVVLAEP
ncbi:MAG: ATP-binding protein [Pyrinomonadaceae bacterium]